MGLIIPKETPKAAAGQELESKVSLRTPPERPGTGEPSKAPEGGPNANLLNRADFPTRDLPPITGMRDARFQVVFRQSVLNEIHAHGKTSMEAEVCGVLIGDIYADRMAPWAYVEHCIRGNDAVGKQTQVTITSETWSRIHETLEKDFPGKKIIGWYHTHPGFGIFLSGMDLFIQDNFFNQPWQIATVYDPHSGDEGTFVWRAGKSNREASLVENDIVPASPAAGVENEVIEELTQRVKTLERRLDRLMTALLLLVFLALTAPLIFFWLRPDAVSKIPILHPAAPAATQPVPAQNSTPAVPAPVAPPAASRKAAAATPPAVRPAPVLVRRENDSANADGPLTLYPKSAQSH